MPKEETGKHKHKCGFDSTPERKKEYLRTFKVMGSDHQICQYCGFVIYNETKTEKEDKDGK